VYFNINNNYHYLHKHNEQYNAVNRYKQINIIGTADDVSGKSTTYTRKHHNVTTLFSSTGITLKFNS